MTEVQKILVNLLDEIDYYCKTEGLSYFLGQEVAVSAFRSGCFESETSEVNVFMTLPDVLHLQDAIFKKNDKDRVLESLYNNDFYPDLSFRYCNRNTLCINLNTDGGIKNPGICVNIKVLRKSSKGFIKLIERYLERGWNYNYIDFQNSEILSKKGRILQKLAGVLLNVSRRTYKKVLLKCIEFSQKGVSFKDKLYYKNNNKKIYFPKELFSRQQEVRLEEHSYPIPEKSKNFFKVMYGEKWKSKVFTTKESNDSKIIDPRLPYEIYFVSIENSDIFANYRKAKEIELTTSTRLKEVNNVLNHAWKCVIRTGDRLNMWCQYMPQKDKILSLYNEGMWDELRDLLSDYDKKVRENAKVGLGLCFDYEIFEIYRKTVSHYGENEFADKCLRLIPEIHLHSPQIID